jgi:DNA polymerase III delta prime subunit|tara:strand:- start:320 stop:1306 length:987 start_codon:yes stop_codon:yes gene_type:complete
MTSSITHDANNALWCERYRPKSIKECILPPSLKGTFQEIVDTGEVPNLLFSGTAGTGKTTVARAICEELSLDYIIINASESGNIDTLRGKIKQFASSISLSGGYKVVILDEADYLNAQSTQPALRGFIEEFSANCRFILTCNFKNRIIEPLHSRCGVIEFNTTKKEMATLCQSFMERTVEILKNEGISDYPMEQLAELIMRHAPDWRRVLNELQRHSKGGSLSLDVIGKVSGGNTDELFGYLKSKDFKKMRVWVANNMDVESTVIFRSIYDQMNGSVDPNSIPQVVLILADYSYKGSFMADAELNVVACFTEIMSQCNFLDNMGAGNE